MNISELNLKKNNPEKLLSFFNSGELKANKTEIKNLQGEIYKSVSNGIFVVAINACVLGLLVAPELTLDTIRRKGLFRYSSYITKKCIVKDLSVELLKFLKVGGIDDPVLTTYLESVINFAYIRQEYAMLRGLILEEFKHFRKYYGGRSLIKTLMSHADALFLMHYMPIPEKKGNMNSIYSRSKEEICSATSYLIFTLSSVETLKVDGSKVADEYITSEQIHKLLLPAALIQDYKEIELLIEHYGYTLERNRQNWRLKPPTPNFERDMRLGYIRTDMQAINIGLSFVRWSGSGKEILSIRRVVQEMINLEDFIKFEFTTSNDYPRYRVMMPDITYQILYEKFFNDENLFEEEAYHLSWIFREQLLDLDSLKKVFITDNLRLIDFLKIKRYFLFMHMLFEEKFGKINDVNTAWLLHSLVPQINDIHLDTMFKSLGNKKMIDDFMDIVCWEKDDAQLFDLQYQPIIFLDGQYLMPFNIVAQMNVVRNLYASEYKKQNKNLLSDGQIDPLTDKLSESMSAAGIVNIKEFKYKGGEIDIVGLSGDTLILIECKHSLHPADLYELRRTYDYVKKAEKQLDRALDHYHNHNLIKGFETQFGQSLRNTVKRVLTLIVTSNRILSGNNFSHPVRDINELDNFITKGTFMTNDGEFSLYQSDKFQLSELIDYLENDSIVINHMRGVMEQFTQYYQTSTHVLEYDTYFMNMEHALKQVKGFTSTLKLINNLDDLDSRKRVYN